jgi:hypothetical protein
MLDRLRSRLGTGPGTGFPAPAPSRPLPAWFVGNRVHGQTRLQFNATWHDTDEFKRAAEGFKALGARVFTRHVKSAAEDPPWPTALPTRLSDGRPLSDGVRVIHGVRLEPGRNVAREVVDEAHDQGLRIVTYYWHMTEASFTDPHPDVEPHEDWICRHPDGAVIVHKTRGTHLDISGPYRDVVLTRLLELAAMGADGFNFDERHLPPAGSWGSALEDAWREEKGVDAPLPDEDDPDYLAFLDFRARRIEDTFVFWRDAVKARHPNVVFAVSTTTIPALTSREMTTRLARVADAAKNEYRLAVNTAHSKHVFPRRGEDPAGKLDPPPDHVRQALGWTVLRDAADGRPPRIWAPGLPNVDHAKAFAASLITFGCIAHMDVQERAILGREQPEDGKTPLEGIRAAFALGDRVSPHLANVVPVRWAALHFGEGIRNLRGSDYRAAWVEVLWPLVGAYQALCEDGLPAGIVNDRQLELGQLAGYRLLFLTNPRQLTKTQKQSVGRFRAAGGIVVENDPGWAWSDPALRPAAFAAFRGAVARHVGTAPVVARGGPQSRYAVPYRARDKLVVAVTNDFGWVQVTRPPDERDGGDDDDDGGGGLPDVVNPRAPDAAGVRVVWRRGHGLPQAALPTRFHRLRAIDAASGATLPVEAIAGGYRVSLPPFAFMSLLVVTPVRFPFPPGRGRRRRP